jgi:hypothetical protein
MALQQHFSIDMGIRPLSFISYRLDLLGLKELFEK